MNIRRELPKNPLIRDGVSQPQRRISALSPDYVKIDEGDLADFLVFAYKLSKQVIYYGDDNQPEGNWQEFFQHSTPVQIALISKTRPQKIKDEYTKKWNQHQNNLTVGTTQTILEFWKKELLTPILDWYEALESSTPMKSIIRGLVKTNLKAPLRRMYFWERMKGNLERTIYEQFDSTFKLDLTSIPTNDEVLTYSQSISSDELEAIFQALFKTYRQIIQEAPKYLKDSLTGRQDHPPHLALYYAFWEVMQPFRDDLNRMTQRHLDFFYRQVLRLSDRPAEPDRAHLIFELAKSQTEYKLDAETRFKAGKDASGVELFYKLDTETILHRATIASLKGLFLDIKEIPTPISKNILGLYISPQANSFDGQGGDFPKEQAVKAWLPFGDRTRNHAVLGLAIACNIFYLQEGTRTLIFTLTFNQAPIGVKASDLPNIFTVDFSGQKDWVLGKIRPPEVDSGTSLEGQILKLEVSITTDQEAIGNYHHELPGAALPTNEPVARIFLKDEVRVNNCSPYSYFRHLKLTGLHISTKEIDVRNLVLQNDLLPISPAKPFQPFGPRPMVGSTFYVGSKEIFQKHLSRLKIKIVWQGLPVDLAAYYRGYYVEEDSDRPDFKNFSAEVKRLTQHNWSAEGLPDQYNLFTPAGDRILVDRTAPQTPLPGEQIDSLTEFNLHSDSGFLRFVLQQDFLHNEFASKYALQTLASAKDFTNKKEYLNGAVYELSNGTFKRWHPGVTFPTAVTAAPITLNEPYTPVIQSIALSYIAVAELKDCKLFHLHPFERFEELVLSDTVNFLPQFSNEGELLIGLSDLDPPTGLPLLFQVAEETADTALKKVDVQWHYLQDNTWISLSDRIVSDSTNGLINSGIVNLAIPEEISKAKTTILDPSLYWIKASVPERSGAICQIIGIHTQAAQVTFTDEGNDQEHLATPLPSGSIAKLAIPVSAIKKVEQPYNSFGGKVKEQPEHFYTRISEYLRHKGRAVTIFDYERLVLEKFPQIYKVRCINHGQIGKDQQFQELVPGAVTLVVIPDLSQRNTTNDLEPKVNINLLDKIAQYLATISSPWANIQVVNPVYEHIQVEFEVQFQSQYQANFGYYSRTLVQAITNFLAPWTVDQGAEIHFQGTVYRSSILNFIQQQYYVEYVFDFQMHYHNQRNVQQAIASTARSVLTSVSIATTGQTHIIKEATIPGVKQKQPTEDLGLSSQALEDIIL